MNRLFVKKMKSEIGARSEGHLVTPDRPFWLVKYVYLSWLPFVIEIVFALFFLYIVRCLKPVWALNVKIASEIFEY